jgi:hypothetical protein
VPFKLFKTLDAGVIAAGQTTEQSWESDADYTIHRIFFVEKAGNPINAVEVTIRKEAENYTKDYIPAAVLAYNNVNNPILDVSLKDGEKIVFGIKNNETAARSLYIVMELWT